MELCGYSGRTPSGGYSENWAKRKVTQRRIGGRTTVANEVTGTSRKKKRTTTSWQNRGHKDQGVRNRGKQVIEAKKESFTKKTFGQGNNNKGFAEYFKRTESKIPSYLVWKKAGGN